MKRIAALFVLLFATTGFAQAPWVTFHITNSDPSTPRAQFNGSFQRLSSYELNWYFRSAVTNPIDITGRTITLNWKRTGNISDSPVTRLTGSVISGTSGHCRVLIPANAINSAGDSLFQIVAANATNRASFFIQATVYDSVDQLSDVMYVPSSGATNFYTQEQIDALLSGYATSQAVVAIKVNNAAEADVVSSLFGHSASELANDVGYLIEANLVMYSRAVAAPLSNTASGVANTYAITNGYRYTCVPNGWGFGTNWGREAIATW